MYYVHLSDCILIGAMVHKIKCKNKHKEMYNYEVVANQ